MAVEALKRHIVSVGVAGIFATLSPATASAGSSLYGLVWPNGAGVQFGSIDTTASSFSPISTTNLTTAASYATPVYDPAQNAFYVPDQPASQVGELGSPQSNAIDRIDATTGAVTQLLLHGPSNPVFVEALGLASSVAPVAASEPPATLLLLVALFGIICATWRRPRDMGGTSV